MYAYYEGAMGAIARAWDFREVDELDPASRENDENEHTAGQSHLFRFELT